MNYFTEVARYCECEKPWRLALYPANSVVGVGINYTDSIFVTCGLKGQRFPKHCTKCGNEGLIIVRPEYTVEVTT